MREKISRSPVTKVPWVEIAREFVDRPDGVLEVEIKIGDMVCVFRKNGRDLHAKLQAALDEARRDHLGPGAEALVLELACRWALRPEIEKMLRVLYAQAAAEKRAEKRHPKSKDIARLIRTRGLSDHALANVLKIDRKAVARERELLGFTPAQVRAIRDEL